jgi:hypothetical protein
MIVSYTDTLNTIQLIANVAVFVSVIILFWYSRKQDQRSVKALEAQVRALEAQTLSDFNEELYRLDASLMEHPQFFRLISSNPSEEKLFAFYILNVFCHTHDMNERGLMIGEEWEGNLQWMKMAFKNGTVGDYWKNDPEFRLSYDKGFRDFVDNVLLK